MCLEHSPLDAADLDLEDAARTFPVVYSADEMPDLAYSIERHQPDPGNEVGRWAHQFLPPRGSIIIVVACIAPVDRRLDFRETL